MGDVYPEITEKVNEVKQILEDEEKSFARTLDRGEVLFERAVAKMKEQDPNNKVFSGADVWKLYDTYGFPVDLTRIMAEDCGLTINEEEFLDEQAKAKERSKAVKGGEGAKEVKLDVHSISHLESIPVPKTKDEFKYTHATIQSSILKIMTADKQFVDFFSTSQELIGLILDKTNFYAESGGQETDTGRLSSNETVFNVTTVQEYAGYVLHVGYLSSGSLSCGDKVDSEYDTERRQDLMSNHTATHIVNYALKSVLGDGIDQKGSLVAKEKLRFDYSHSKSVEKADLEKVESICDEFIKANTKVSIEVVSLDAAKQIRGLRAVFGEVYPDPVRVVSVGADVKELLKDPSNPEWEKVSVEFCGGTYVVLIS